MRVNLNQTMDRQQKLRRSRGEHEGLGSTQLNYDVTDLGFGALSERTSTEMH